jgi:hypothetical protein
MVRRDERDLSVFTDVRGYVYEVSVRQRLGAVKQLREREIKKLGIIPHKW